MSLELIKQLRERTGVGMAKCKEALAQSGGDLDEAISYLRKTGMATAVKKSDRESKEGKIVVAETADTVAIVEISSETDFVANNEKFLEFAENIAQEVAKQKPGSVEEFLQAKFSKDPSITLDEYRGSVIQAIGENIQIKRVEIFPKSGDKSVGVYSHMGGKIVTAVVIEGGDRFVDVAKEVAMHAAAAAPDFIRPDYVPESIVAQEKEIALEQVKNKPEQVQGKIIEGKMQSFYDQVCLERQKFIRDDTVSIAQLVAKSGDPNAKITGYLRWSVGE